MRKMKIMGSLAVAMLLVSGLSGCGADNKNINNVDISYNLESVNSNKKATIKKFNLGKSVIKEGKREVPFDIEGVLGVPEEINEKAPIVFIFHGQHSGDAKANFEDGFKYLVEEFAKNGIIAIAVDDQVNHTWEYGEPLSNERVKEVMQVHLNNIIKANNGENINYGIDLKNKVDIDNVGLIGHSMCGEGIFKIAKDQQQKGFSGIKGLLAIAPSNNEVIENYPDIATSVIVSEYDGDVMDSGASIYDNIFEQGKRKNPLILSYLIGGNHNYFNTVVENNKEMSTPQTTNGGYPEKLTNIEQRDFMGKYAVDFFNGVLKSEKVGLLDTDKPIPSTMYGYKVLHKVDGMDNEVALDAKKFENKSNEEIKIDNVIESGIPSKDELKLFTALGYKEKIELVKVDWLKNNSSIKLDIPDLSKEDISKIKGIKFRWALDSTNELNSKDNNINLKVNIVDKKGKVDSINLDSNTSALKYFEGEIIKSENFEGTFDTYWSRKNPISDTVIPSSVLKNVDLSNLSNIELEFIEPAKGSILIESVSILH